MPIQFSSSLKKLIKTLFLVITFLSGTQIMYADNQDSIAIMAAKGLVKRVMPLKYNQHIKFELIPDANGMDLFEVEQQGQDIIIRGNGSNSMAVGFKYYLKHYCKISVSWYRSDVLDFPATLPRVESKIHKLARCHNRFFLNYCTFGYTMPWWQWEDWQWFIDWMALNGINMPLATTGQEAIWYKVWKKFGLTDIEIREYFTGPAFLPWNRMANIDHWDGPLPKSWLESQLNLQKKIVARERELGMRPILPAFAGHVPLLLKKLFPQAKITSLGNWAGFTQKNNSYFLDTFDPLFLAIQKEYLKQQTRLLGTDHIYGIDLFNEVTPPSWEPAYLSDVSRNTYASLRAADTAARWLQMGWMFYHQKEHWTLPRIKAYLTAVPPNKLIMLDYFGDNSEVWKTTDKFFGQPYIWCYLGNFGGNTMLKGNLSKLDSRLEKAFEQGGKNMSGIGSTLEGFDMNPMLYEFLFEKAWVTGDTDIKKWVSDYAISRTGNSSENALKSWQLLDSSVYVQFANVGQSVLTNARPSLTGHGAWSTDPQIAYKNSDLGKVWQLQLANSHKALSSAYRFDLVNTGRQLLGNYFNVVRDSFTVAYNKKDRIALRHNGEMMLEIIDDMDLLLATDKTFLLGRWINQARALGNNNLEMDYYEHDARKILTTWGSKGSELTDYASRNWSGLMKSYYRPRWVMFIDQVEYAVKFNKPFDNKLFEQKSNDFEDKWTRSHSKFTSNTTGDAWSVSQRIYQKYATRIGVK